MSCGLAPFVIKDILGTTCATQIVNGWDMLKLISDASACVVIKLDFLVLGNKLSSIRQKS